VEELTAEILAKEDVIASLNTENASNIERFEQERAEATQVEHQKEAVEARVRELENYIKRMKV